MPLSFDRKLIIQSLLIQIKKWLDCLLWNGYQCSVIVLVSFYLAPYQRPGTGDIETPHQSPFVFALTRRRTAVFSSKTAGYVHHVLGVCWAFPHDMVHWIINKSCWQDNWVKWRYIEPIFSRNFFSVQSNNNLNKFNFIVTKSKSID